MTASATPTTSTTPDAAREAFVTLTGRIHALDPMSITLPDSKEAFPTMPVVVGDAVVRVPMIPSTTLKGGLRRAAVRTVIAAMGPGPDGRMGMRRDDYHWNAIGGVKGKATDSRGRDIHIAREHAAANPIIALFGAGEIFVEGLMSVKESRLMGPFSLADVTMTLKRARIDDMSRDRELLAQLSEADVEAEGRYVVAKKKVSAGRTRLKMVKKEMGALLRRGRDNLDAAERGRLDALLAEQRVLDSEKNAIQTDKGGDFKEQIGLLYEYSAIAAGTTFETSLRFPGVEPLQFGLFLAACRTFSRRCRFGGKRTVGMGGVRIEWAIARHDGATRDALDNPVTTDAGRIVVEQDSMRVESDDAFVIGSVASWRDAVSTKLAGLDFRLPRRDPGEADGAADDEADAA